MKTWFTLITIVAIFLTGSAIARGAFSSRTLEAEISGWITEHELPVPFGSVAELDEGMIDSAAGPSASTLGLSLAGFTVIGIVGWCRRNA